MADLVRKPVEPLSDAEQAVVEQAVDVIDQVSDTLDDCPSRGMVAVARARLQAVMDQLDTIVQSDCTAKQADPT